MLPNIFAFSYLNFPQFYYGMMQQPLVAPFYASEPCLNVGTNQNIQNAEESDKQQYFKLTLTKKDLQQEGTGISKKHWTQEQDRLLKQYAQHQNFDWSEICKKLPGRNQKMCYSRYRRIENETKAYWTNKQNLQIKKFFEVDKMSWKAISKLFPNRTAKQIREHYLNFLRPNIKRDEWTLEQDLKIIELYNLHGKKWKMFEKQFSGRTQNQIKNRFYGRLKRLQTKKELFAQANE